MKRLSKQQETDHRDLVRRLQGAHQDLDGAIDKYNKVVAQAFDGDPAIQISVFDKKK